MARAANTEEESSMPDTQEDNVVPFAESKEPDFTKCPKIVEEIDKLNAEIDKTMDAAREECAPQRERIKELRVKLHDETGYALSAIAAALATRRQAQKQSRRLAKLRDEHRKQAQKLHENLPAANVQYSFAI